MQNYKFTIIGTCTLILLNTIFMHYDFEPFDELISFLESVEHFELDEFIIPLVLIFIFLLIDKITQYKKKTFENEKILFYKEKLESNSQMINDLLCQLQIFKFEAEKSKDFDKKKIDDLNKLINQIMEESK